jgi:hypothetical protein
MDKPDWTNQIGETRLAKPETFELRPWGAAGPPHNGSCLRLSSRLRPRGIGIFRQRRTSLHKRLDN